MTILGSNTTKNIVVSMKTSCMLQVQECVERIHEKHWNPLLYGRSGLFKTFDKVPSKSMICKLAEFELHNGFLTHVKSCHSKFKCSVFVNDHPSDAAGVFSGVPQSFVLGQFVFFLSITDLPVLLLDFFPLLFADKQKFLFRSVIINDDLTRLYH